MSEVRRVFLHEMHHMGGLKPQGSWATFDPSKRYRYTLGRSWDYEKGRCAFIMLNPSTADASKLDPTVTRCLAFAKQWGFGSLEVGNIFAFRSTDPRGLKTIADPVGPENDKSLLAIQDRASLVVAAWGIHGKLHARGTRVKEMLSARGPLSCFGTTDSGEPAHPLYLPASAKLRAYGGLK